MGKRPEERPLKEEQGELAKGLVKLPPDAVDASNLEEVRRKGVTG